MTHLALALNRLIARNEYGYTSKVARKVGVTKGYLSLLTSGRRTRVSRDLLPRLVNAMTTSETERAELIVAHLIDESCGYFPKRIEINIKNGKQSGKRKTP